MTWWMTYRTSLIWYLRHVMCYGSCTFSPMQVPSVSVSYCQFLNLLQVTYNTMLDAYSKGGHFVKARQVLDNMKQAGCAPNLWTYNILLDSLGKAGCIDEAAQLYDDLKSAGHSPNLVSFSAMINTYGRWGLFAEAQKLWQEMRAAGCVPDATVFCGLINSYSHHGMHQVISQHQISTWDKWGSALCQVVVSDTAT